MIFDIWLLCVSYFTTTLKDFMLQILYFIPEPGALYVLSRTQGGSWAATAKGIEVSTSTLAIYKRGIQSTVLPKNTWPQGLCFEDKHRDWDPSELAGRDGLWLGFHSFYNHGLWPVIPCEGLISKEAFLGLQTRRQRLRGVESPCQSCTARRQQG